MPHELTVGSLFAGIGGFDLGLERAGMRTVWFCESDPYCQQVLARHWPDIPCHPDITRLDAAHVTPVDVLCGGFPCQPVSENGHGALCDDPRWLWPEFARLIRDIRPRYVLVENVAALLHRGLRDVLGDLAALRYDAEWSCLPAAAFGAPHRRDRLWLVAYPDWLGREAAPRVFGSEPAQDLCIATPWRSVPRRGADGRVRPFPHANVLGMADGFPSELDAARLGAVGNALVPQIAEWIGRRIVTWENGA